MNRFRTWMVGLAAAVVTFMAASPAFAQEHGAAGNGSRDAWLAIASGITIAIASLGGALSQSKAASTALDGIARNPGASGKIFTPMLLGLALIETLVLFAFVIAFSLAGKIGG